MAKKKSPTPSEQLPLERIEQKILLIRDQKVMLDADLAEFVWCDDRSPGAPSQAQPEAIPKRLLLSIDGRRMGSFEMPIWHLKGPRRPTVRALRLF